jgi:hypothetical protein
MDREFECLRDDIHGVLLNTTATSEHVPEIERQIRVIKERARAIRSTLPFKKMPNRMIVELINFVVLWLNDFPPSSGVSKIYSPRTIMTGTTLDYNKHCKLSFGAYVEMHEMNTPTNTEKKGRVRQYLGPTANFQGSYKFLCLRTGRRITRKQFRELPMPATVIEAIDALAEREKQDSNLDFTDHDGSPYENLENDTNQPTDGDAVVDNEDPNGTSYETIYTDESNEAPHIQTEHPGDWWAIIHNTGGDHRSGGNHHIGNPRSARRAPKSARRASRSAGRAPRSAGRAPRSAGRAPRSGSTRQYL